MLSSGAVTTRAATRTARLDNGLKVLIQEVHTAPLVSVWCWYRVGSGDEYPGRTGVSHWVEHMNFKGTRNIPRDDMKGIVEIQLRRLQKLLVDRKITLDIDEAAERWIADKGYDPVYGARPLKRVIQRELQNPLAQQILEGRIPDGSAVHVGATPLGLTIGEVMPAVAAQ